MRIIIISDIHANIVALESVMTKVKVHRPDVILCLGDLVGYGPHPNEVVEYIRNSNIVCTLGGADERLAYDFARDKRPRAGVADKTLEWTRTVIEEHNLAFLRNLPIQARVNTPFGRLRFFHASIDTTQRTVRLGNDPIAEKYFKSHRAKIIAYGKTHVPQIRKGPFGVVVNPGSVGLSLNGEPGADYAVLDITADKVSVEMDKVEYDFAAVAFEIAAWELPSVVGEAVQQGKMPMDGSKMQRDPSKVRIQTKIVVGRQGRSESAGGDSKIVEDKNIDISDKSQLEEARAETMLTGEVISPLPTTTPLERSVVPASLPAPITPSDSEPTNIATPNITPNITPNASTPLVSGSVTPSTHTSTSPTHYETSHFQDADSHPPRESLPSEELEPKKLEHLVASEAVTPAPPTASTSIPEVPPVSEIPFLDIPAEVAQAPESAETLAASEVPESPASHKLTQPEIAKSIAYELDIDDPQEMYDSPARYSDDGMLNLDALEDTEAIPATLAQNRAEARLLAEVEAEEQAHQQGRQTIAAMPASQEADSSETRSQQQHAAAQLDSIEEAIEKKVANAMLELQRQLKQAVAGVDNQSMSIEELQKLQKNALNLESLKALLLQQETQSLSSATTEQKTQTPSQAPVSGSQAPVSEQDAKPSQKAADNFLPSNFFDD